MSNLLRRAWQRVHEPRVVSMLRCLMYLVLLGGGLAAIVHPPTSLEGEVGTLAMTALATLLAFGGLLGAIAALPGAWWLERTALLAIIAALMIYGLVVTIMHVQGTGNRLLQLSMIAAVILSQAIRWVRIRGRPYDPDLTTAATAPSAT